MSAPIILSAFMVAAILSILACAMPMDDSKSNENQKHQVPRMTLDQVLNKTVCPIRVEYDVKENRVPRTIKVMKCAAEPSHCSRSDVTSHDCCKHKNEKMGCVELRDLVIVGYRTNENKLNHTVIEVSVGCSCMFGQPTRAQDTNHHN